jgi:hypothetical protein
MLALGMTIHDRRRRLSANERARRPEAVLAEVCVFAASVDVATPHLPSRPASSTNCAALDARV